MNSLCTKNPTYNTLTSTVFHSQGLAGTFTYLSLAPIFPPVLPYPVCSLCLLWLVAIFGLCEPYPCPVGPLGLPDRLPIPRPLASLPFATPSFAFPCACPLALAFTFPFSLTQW